MMMSSQQSPVCKLRWTQQKPAACAQKLKRWQALQAPIAPHDSKAPAAAAAAPAPRLRRLLSQPLLLLLHQ
jgi:hypothetical protein